MPYYLELLQALHPLFSLTSKGTEGSVVDNAAAAVARMIMAAPGAVPMDQVLPVFLSALPLKSDRSENEAVYTCLLGLVHLRHPEALRLLESIMSESLSFVVPVVCFFVSTLVISGGCTCTNRRQVFEPKWGGYR